MQFTLFSADCIGKAANCSYPHKVLVDDAMTMEGAVAHDHVCATYKNNYRNIANFQMSDVVPMDIDNDHSDNPADWITEDKMDELFGSIDYVLVPSRHHMLPKDGKSARPRYHVYFPIENCTDADEYTAIKVALQKAYSFFDDNALDAARFLFGADADEVVWHEGWMLITDDLVIEETTEEDEEFNDGVVSGPITKGSRNNTLSRFAGRVLKKYGECDKAREVFLEQAERCDPPLEDSELNTIWFSALKFFRNKVSKDSGYIPPDQYNNDFGDGAGSLKPEDYSDVGQAKVLSREYGDELKFTAATDFIRFDGEVWVEDKQMAVGACVEFLDLQLQDAKDSIEVAMKALVDAGYDETLVKQGSKALAKEIQTEHLSLFYMLVGAEKYLAFAMKRRDYKYITSALNVAKSMLTIKVSDLDKDPVLLNTPRATYNLEKGIAGEQPHDPFDLITKITECSREMRGWISGLRHLRHSSAVMQNLSNMFRRLSAWLQSARCMHLMNWWWSMREKFIESKLVSEVKKRGGICLKWVCPSFDGMPDRLVFLPGRHFGMVEVKAPGEKPRPLQVSRHKLLQRLGFKVYVLDAIEDIGGILDEIQTT